MATPRKGARCTLGISSAALHRSVATSGWDILDAAPSVLVQRSHVKPRSINNTKSSCTAFPSRVQEGYAHAS